MPLTARDLHDAFRAAQRKIYAVPQTKYSSWKYLNENERAAYECMAESLNKRLAKQAEKPATEQEAASCPDA
jgi:hypothetical protein